MKIKQEYNRIPATCVEHFIPQSVLSSSIFKRMGIIQGGISSLVEGFCARRTANRDYHILCITLSGNGEYTFEDGNKITTKRKDMFFSHADGQGHMHRPYGKGPWKILWLQIEKNNAWLVPPSKDWILCRAMAPHRLAFFLEEIFIEELNKELDSISVQALYAQLFLVALQRELQNNGSSKHIHYKQNFARLWFEISSSLENKWDLEQMCAHIDLSPAHFSRLCNQFYHKAPGEKVREIRMEHAKALLQNLDCPISEVAQYIGYESTPTFSAAFTNYYGLSPRKMRKLAAKVPMGSDEV